MARGIVARWVAVAACVAAGAATYVAREESAARRVAETFRTDAERELSRLAAAASRPAHGAAANAVVPVAPPSAPPPAVAAEATGELAAWRRRAEEAESLAARLRIVRAAEAPRTPPEAGEGGVAAGTADVSSRTAVDAVDEAVEAALRGAADFAAALVRSPLFRDALRRGLRIPGDPGARALRLLADVEGVSVAELADAATAAGRLDAGFTAALAEAFRRRVAGDPEAAAKLRPFTRDDRAPAVRLAALDAAYATGLPDAAAWIAAAAARSPDESSLAMRLLPSGSPKDRSALAAAARAAAASPALRAAVLGALLPAASVEEAPLLAEDAAALQGGARLLSAVDRAEEARPFLVAAFADRIFDDAEARAYVAKEAGLPLEASPRAVAARLFADRAIVAALAARAADRRGPPPEDPAAFATFVRDAQLGDARDLADRAERTDPDRRAPIVVRLLRFGHPAGVAAVRALADSEYVADRAHAALLAAESGVGELAEFVAQLAGDPVEDVRFAAADALERLGAPLDPAVGVPLLDEARLGVAEPVVASLLRSPDRSRTLGLLLSAFEAGAVREEAGAADAAVRLAADGGPEALVALLAHPAATLRAAAIAALAAGPEVERATYLGLFDRAATDADFRVRIAAAEGLGRVRDDLARARLVQLLRDPAGFVREAALRALARQDPLRVVAAVRRALPDEDPDVRVAARTALLLLGVEDDLPALRAALSDPWHFGRVAAALRAHEARAATDGSGR